MSRFCVSSDFIFLNEDKFEPFHTGKQLLKGGTCPPRFVSSRTQRTDEAEVQRQLGAALLLHQPQPLPGAAAKKQIRGFMLTFEVVSC